MQEKLGTRDMWVEEVEFVWVERNGQGRVYFKGYINLICT